LGIKVDNTLSIDDIYERVKDYDLVLSVDAPLVDALKMRTERPRLGRFAATPRRLVYAEGGEKLMDKRALFHYIVRNTNLGWREASYLLDKAVSCWQETGSLENVLHYEGFNKGRMKTVVQALRETDNIFNEMDGYKLKRESVVIINEHQFNELDKKVLPEDYETLEVFTDKNKEIPEFSLFSSEVDIVEAVRRNLKRLDPKDVAVVVDPESKYQPLIQSALESEDISYTSRRNLRDDPHFRIFLMLCRTSVGEGRTLIRNVQPLLRYMELEVPVDYNNQYLEDVDGDNLEKFKEIIKETEADSFGGVLDLFEERSGNEMGKLREVLEEAGFDQMKVNEDNLDLMEHYFDTFDIELEEEGYGVLFASPRNTSYIDKPVVLHIGMDTSWSPESPDEPWIEKREFDERKLKNFKILIQNEGSHYLVQDRFMNDDVTPCLYFNDLIDGSFKGFSDLPHERWFPDRSGEKGGFEAMDMGVEVQKVNTISQSSLNKFVQCPRNYYFHRLVSSVDRDVMVKGNLFHDFAEFYVNHPDFVKELNPGRLADMMVERIKPYVDDLELDLLRTDFIIGMENIISYLEEEGYEEVGLRGYEEREQDNFFAERFDMSIRSKVTEASFNNEKLGARGIVDLIKDKNHLVDYKTGIRKSERNVVTNSNLDLVEERPNFQALLYLAHHRTVVPDQKLKFTFYHLLDNRDDFIKGRQTIGKNKTTVVYYPETFGKWITGKEAFGFLRSSNVRKRLLDALGYERYKTIMKSMDFVPEDCYYKDRMKDKYTEEMVDRCRPLLEIGRGKDVTKKQLKGGCGSILKKLVAARKKNYFKEDIDKFDDFLDEKLEELNRYKKSRFPVGDVDLDKIYNRDLIITGGL